MTAIKKSTTHLLLAAGASTRMGRPKQLLRWQDKSLIRHAIETIQQAGAVEKIVVVVGANRQLILPEINDLEVEIVVNPDWAEGMGSTIRAGLQFVLDHSPKKWAAVGISLVDQPLVTSHHIRSLYQLWEHSNRPIAAASYNDILGVPAIFDQHFFPELLALDGAAGARKVLMRHRDEVAPMDLPEAKFDLDTPEDYDRLFDDHGKK